MNKITRYIFSLLPGLPAGATSSNLISLLPRLLARTTSSNLRIADVMGNVSNVTLFQWNINSSAEELSEQNAMVQELALHLLESHWHYSSPSVPIAIAKRTTAKKTVAERTTAKKTIAKRRSIRIKNINKKMLKFKWVA